MQEVLIRFFFCILAITLTWDERKTDAVDSRTANWSDAILRSGGRRYLHVEPYIPLENAGASWTAIFYPEGHRRQDAVAQISYLQVETMFYKKREVVICNHKNKVIIKYFKCFSFFYLFGRLSKYIVRSFKSLQTQIIKKVDTCQLGDFVTD